MRLSLFISLPAMAGLIALAAPIIGLLFGRGAFGPEAIHATASALVAYGVGLPAIALVRPLVGAFYALGDTRTPVLVATLCVVLNVLLGWVLMQSFAHAGLALAVSLSSFVNVGLLSWRLKRRVGTWALERDPTVKCALASLGMGMCAWATADTHLVWALLIPVWAWFYFALAKYLGLTEANMLLDALNRRVRARFKRGEV
jgi:putative peptidoglycan lipid II flippase